MARRLRAVLLAACVVPAAVATSSVANAACTPAADATPLPASGTTVTCSGTTTDQNAGANAGYGTGNQTGVTVNVVAGGGNTVNGTTYGVYLAMPRRPTTPPRASRAAGTAFTPILASPMSPIPATLPAPPGTGFSAAPTRR